ncbi:recombinase family protein [Blastochloris tepida]|uniref:Resolvase n=1 Tax=Blastochloris tepida TaxID=2233851 RepID=A0A348FYT4_9HYPH|nr:recombinase family protein [Blastochloris tepida]BBF92467.1 resolvase [Blastochloris tepida]
MRVAVYLRVSTNGQTVENQRLDLVAAGDRHGWQIAAEFVDEGVSGARGRDERPAMRELMRAVGRREVDMIAAWDVSRLGRSLADLLGFLGELHAKGVGLYLHQQGLDTTTPTGRAMFQMMGVFAEFERAMIRERVNTGLARARAEGKALGRPRIDPEVERQIAAALRKGGRGIRKVAADLGVGVGTVQRVRDAMTSAGAAG